MQVEVDTIIGRKKIPGSSDEHVLELSVQQETP